jgi:hypothetical protein
MAIYAGDISFNQLERASSQNKAILDSWALSERTYEPNKSFYSYGTSLDPIGSMFAGNNRLINDVTPYDNPKEAYQKYSWLFKKPK